MYAGIGQLTVFSHCNFNNPNFTQTFCNQVCTQNPHLASQHIMNPMESKSLSEHENTAHTHWTGHTFNICVVVALLSSGQTWRAGAGGAGGSAGMQHAACALWAPPAAHRGTHCLPGERSCTGVIQQRDCSPADSCTQRYHPHISTLVRGCKMCHT